MNINLVLIELQHKLVDDELYFLFIYLSNNQYDLLVLD